MARPVAAISRSRPFPTSLNSTGGCGVRMAPSIGISECSFLLFCSEISFGRTSIVPHPPQPYKQGSPFRPERASVSAFSRRLPLFFSSYPFSPPQRQGPFLFPALGKKQELQEDPLPRRRSWVHFHSQVHRGNRAPANTRAPLCARGAFDLSPQAGSAAPAPTAHPDSTLTASPAPGPPPSASRR